MRTLTTAVAVALAAPYLMAQSVANPGFESGGAFSMEGWSWFCSSPDFASTYGHSGCCALMLPTSDDNSPCFSTGQAIGVHTLMSGVQAGIPYQLSIWENMSDPNINSDVGIFAVPAGQTPSSFGGMVLGWPAGFGNPGQWVQDIIPFTIPIAYAGMDFYFFIEYSIAPDLIPGAKFFDDISITELATGLDEHTKGNFNLYPSIATDIVRVDGAMNITNVDLLAADGTTMRRIGLNNERTIDVAGLAPGIYFIRGAEHIARFIKL
ncbi:MAG: T9SS type A sorting domain-containing protein [Flavobacteriales bacterium]